MSMRYILALLVGVASAFAQFDDLAYLSASHSGGFVESTTPDLLWWKLNDGSGGTIAATVGDGGTTDASWVTGKSGSGFALDCDGVSQDALVSGSVTYSTNKITVTFWLYPDATNTTQIIAESSTNISNNQSSWVIDIENTGRLVAGIRGFNTNFRIEWVVPPPIGSWTHVAVVLDHSTAAGDVKFFFNAVEQASTISNNNKTFGENFRVYPLHIGSRNADSLFFNGRIDDFRIYKGDRGAILPTVATQAE